MKHLNRKHGLGDFELSGMMFPSDQLTVRHLRIAFPNEFNCYPDSTSRPSFAECLVALTENERLFAIGTYLQAMSIKSLRLNSDDVEEMKNAIESDYLILGLASSPDEASQMTLAIETQAKAQAEQHGKRSR